MSTIGYHNVYSLPHGYVSFNPEGTWKKTSLSAPIPGQPHAIQAEHPAPCPTVHHAKQYILIST